MAWEVCLLAVAIPVAITLLLPRSNERRVLLVAVIAVLALRYLHWRLTNFPWQDALNTGEGWWWLLVLLVELAVIMEVGLFLATITWLSHRSPQADQAEAVMRQRFEQHGAEALPAVDVLITTYNEGPEVVEKAILGASLIDYPRVVVWVLDDGNRNWLREFCQEAGVRYLAREKHDGAKAGNINHALQHCTGDLVMLFDADFIAYRHCLWRLVGFFDDPRVGTVQTPQNFLNPDALQHNLGLSQSWSDEQSFFFRVIARGRDSLGVAFCCGSCSIHRRAALDSTQGFPTTSITEDILLTVNFCRLGWRTLYLAEPLSIGLAAESLSSFFVQRRRWGRGGIQVAWLMLRQRGLTPLQRLFFFPYSWITQYSSRLFFQCLPILFFFTGLAPLPDAEANQLLSFQLPFLLSVMVGLLVLAERYYLPVFSEAVNLFAAFELAPEILSALVKPFGQAFKVTPKGNDSLTRQRGSYRQTLIPAAVLLTFNVAILFEILLSFGESSRSTSASLLVYGLIWCLFNTTLLVICVLLSLERPQPRQEHRMRIHQPAELLAITGERISGELLDLSLSGARLRCGPHDLEPPGQHWALHLANGLELPVARAWRGSTGDLVMQFADLPLPTRRNLVGYAFTGSFRSAEQPAQLTLLGTLRSLAGALTG